MLTLIAAFACTARAGASLPTFGGEGFSANSPDFSVETQDGHVATDPSDPVLLTDEQVRQFIYDGYLVLNPEPDEFPGPHCDPEVDEFGRWSELCGSLHEKIYRRALRLFYSNGRKQGALLGNNTHPAD